MYIRPAVENLVRSSYGAHTEIAQNGLIDCALGTNAFGTSKRVIEFATKYDDWLSLWQYPDTSYSDLKQEICHLWADYASLTTGNIKVANGATVILSLLNKIFVDPGVRVLGYAPQFPEYMSDVAMFGGKYEAVPLEASENFKFNVDRLLNKIRSGYSIVYIDNPNNPTGQLISLDEIEALAKEAEREGAVVIVDEAYGDYVEEQYSAVTLMYKYPNIIITRTFSKGYGIAQSRVGYAIITDELGHYYDKVSLPFSISTIGAGMAREALGDSKFILDTRRRVKTEKEKLVAELIRKGFLISETSEFCPIFTTWRKDLKDDARLRDYFLSKGILVLSGAEFGNLNEHYVRINTPASAEDFIARLFNKSQMY